MSNRISVNVEVLGLNSSHNYMVPDDMCISKVIEMILKTYSQEYIGAQSARGNTHYLLQAKTGKALPLQCGLRQLAIVNGEKLILT